MSEEDDNDWRHFLT